MPEPLDDATRQRMRRQRRRDTKVEIAVRRELHRLGYRFRVDHRPEPTLRTRGDIVFTRRRVVVFIDGCFWHGCPVHATAPKNNAEWWADKLDANRVRDAEHSRRLHESGWVVRRFWEHQTVGEITISIRRTLGEDIDLDG